VVVLIGLGWVATAEAVPIVSVDPVSQVVGAAPGTASADIIVSGLDPLAPIGGFSFLLNFDDTILQGASFTNDPDGVFAGGLDLSPGFNGGANSPLDVLFSGAGPNLASFRLTSITFNTIANGVSPLTLSSVTLSDLAGGASFNPAVQSGQVCVGGACPVPEPGLFSMLGAGIVALVARRRRTSRA
jgi:hypothetical protein